MLITALLAGLLFVRPAFSAWGGRYRYSYRYSGYGRYNSWNGGYYHGGLNGYNGWTGSRGASRSFYNPYTGRYGSAQVGYNPYTNRYAYHYSYGGY
jgi:hypothetical protein